MIAVGRFDVALMSAMKLTNREKHMISWKQLNNLCHFLEMIHNYPIMCLNE